MYPVDSNYEICRASKSRYETVHGTLTLRHGTPLPIDLTTIVEGGVDLDSTIATKDGTVVVGTVNTMMLTVTLFTEFDEHQLYDGVLDLTYTVYNKYPAEGVTYLSSDCRLGTYRIAEVEKQLNKAKLIAYDNTILLDKGIGARVFAGTPWEVISQACTFANMPFNYTRQSFNVYPNYNVPVQLDTNSGASTCRDIVRFACQLLGVCARASRVDGSLELYTFGTETVGTITSSDKKSQGNTASDYVCTFNGLTVNSAKGTYTSSQTTIGDGIYMYLEDAPAWDYGTDIALQNRVDAVAETLFDIAYTPCELSTFNNPVYDCGDLVEVEVGTTTIDTLITDFKWSFRRVTSIKSAGLNQIQDSMSSGTQKRKTGGGSDANKLVTYNVTNGDDIVLHDDETATLCDISFTSMQATNANWFANIIMTTEADTDYTDVEVTYTYDGNVITFKPHEHYIDGKHTFALFYPISSVTENSVHRWKVEITALDGDVTILQEDFQGSLSGQNFIEQELFDGTLILEDDVPVIAPDTIEPSTLTDALNVTLVPVIRQTLSDSISKVYAAQLTTRVDDEDGLTITLEYVDVSYCDTEIYCGEARLL